MPKKSSSSKSKPLYRTPLPKPKTPPSVPAENNIGRPIAPAHFELREDGTIYPAVENIKPQTGTDETQMEKTRKNICENLRESVAEIQKAPPNRALTAAIPNLIFRDDSHGLWLYHGNCLELLDAIAAKYPQGRFDAIFADPPYFLSNGGITCHAGKMVKVDKGDWDKSRGAEFNHEFNLEWLARCQRVLKSNGTIWVSGTHHVIFSIGYAMQQLGYKILNDIAWEKPNPPPNLSCRYFTHSTETILWAAKNVNSKHVFNYQEMRKVTGKQMKTVWRREEFEQQSHEGRNEEFAGNGKETFAPLAASLLNPVWTMTAPGRDEKEHGKHPTQKPVTLVERCLLASTNPGDLVLDPFLGGGTTAIAAIKTRRGCIGIELDFSHLALTIKRSEREIIEIVLRSLRVRMEISVTGRAELPLRREIAVTRPRPARQQIDLDLFSETINGSRAMDDKPQAPTECIKPLKDIAVAQRGWTLDVLNIVRQLGKLEFTNQDVYAFAHELEKLHPDNRHVRDKIRQQLQNLARAGLLIHAGRNDYRLVK